MSWVNTLKTKKDPCLLKTELQGDSKALPFQCQAVNQLKAIYDIWISSSEHYYRQTV